jgi:hypothetical protein
LGQLISIVSDNTVRIKLLELGDALTLDQALTILHRPKHPNYKLRLFNKTIMPLTPSAARPTNLASHPRATTNRHVLPRTRSLTAKRQRHAVIVVGPNDTAQLSARRSEKAATIAEKTITSRRCVRANPKMWAAFTFNE